MLKIKAQIELYENSRDTPFYSGYRPIFLFEEGEYTSGSIELLEKKIFYPGETSSVNISFGEKKILGPKFNIGVKFIFCESPRSIMGEGIVQEILSII